VFIANLAQGELGIGKSKLLGALLIVSFHLAALRRKERTPFHIVLDEFQTFGASTFAEMLSGIRKYGVSLTLAHQYLDQLGEPLRAALLGTVGTTVAFRIGLRDGEILGPELSLNPSDLASLEPYAVCVATEGRTRQLAQPALLAKRFPSAPERIARRCRNQLAMRRSVAEHTIAQLVDPF
jgi:hypothetical protein